MDPGSLALLIPIVAIAGGCAVKIAKVNAQSRARSEDPQAMARLSALEDEVTHLRQELSETQERVDFTERLLAQQKSDRLGPPS